MSDTHGAMSATSKVGTPHLNPNKSVAATVTVDGDTVQSEMRKTKGASSMKRSESEILNDPEIWMVSESEDDQDFHGEIGKSEDEAKE